MCVMSMRQMKLLARRIEAVSFNAIFIIGSLEDPNFFGVQIAGLQREKMREMSTHIRGIA